MKHLIAASLLGVAAAQQPVYGQCGGKGWTGSTTCASGSVCTYSNDWYSQCLPGTASTTLKTTTRATTTTAGPTKTTTTATKTTTSSTASPTSTKGKLKWLGVNESGAEFGQASYPGVYNKDFTFASTTSIDTLMSQGFNMFRLPFAMERMVPNGLTGAISSAYLTNYTQAVTHITDKGGYAVIDPHNFGRYNGAIITDTTGFQTFWTNLASSFKSNANVVFDTNNEYHDMDQTLVFNLNQAAINGVRGAGATSQYIFAEGNNYSAASQFATGSDNLKGLVDPNNKLVYEMHQYLDSDNSGTSDICVSSTIGVERISPATSWLRSNGKKGIIGENAGGANAQCKAAVTGILDHLTANSDVWLGYLWWGGGPWWGDYIYGFEPPSSTGYSYYDSLLTQYKP